eukprot:gb/GFBE01081172.1/.p1 GENE.gb/GFBE01081172.1/~~gb/GFBE01081172.1/.p1  ORF type:complete len:209 (+),score=55.14 gb/GFBE01081172.1/:1-627(+)
MPARRCRSWARRLCMLAATSVIWCSLSMAFVGAPPARHLRSDFSFGTKRSAESGASELPSSTAVDEAPVDEEPKEGTVSVVIGAKRFRIAWGPTETLAELQKRVEQETEIPPAKQQLKLANQELLEEGKQRSAYEASSKIRTLWLDDLRTPEERGEEVETLVDKLGTLWKLDNVTVLSIVVVAWAFVKDLFPLLISGVKDPLATPPSL